VVIVAEGNHYGPSYKIANDLIEVYSEYETKVTILGHLQRGGAPVTMDRVLASTLGYEAVISLLNSYTNHMIGIVNNEVILTPLKKVVEKGNDINDDLYKLNQILSR
jgi:6-phosphofructokinase 1